MLKSPLGRMRLVLFAFVAAFALNPAEALAHANLARSSPAANANLPAMPSDVTLTFTERPEVRLTQIRVFNAQRQEVESGPPAGVPNDPLSAVEHLQTDLPQGVYTVSWQTTSADDGHVTAGAFAFGVGEAPPAGQLTAAETAPAPGQGPADPIIRWLTYLSVVAAAGLLFFVPLVLQPVIESSGATSGADREWFDRAAGRCRVGATIAAGCAVLAALATIADQAARSGTGVNGISLAATAQTSFGQLLAARLAVALTLFAVLLATSAVATLPHRSLGAAAADTFRLEAASLDLKLAFAGGLILGQLLLIALTSHALTVTGAPELALFVDWLHLIAAGVWVGGLIALAVVVLPLTRGDGRTPLRPVLGQFSRLALLAAIVVALTGAYQALVHVGSVQNAIDTDYGHTLLIKTGVFALALALAALHRWLLKPALERDDDHARLHALGWLSRSLPAEAFLGVGILAATGVLTSLPPANTPETAGRYVRTVGDLRVELQVQPLQIGANTFRVDLASKGKPVPDADKIELQLQHTEMDMGVNVVDLSNAGDGVYTADSDALSMSGPWRVDMLIRVPGQFDQRTQVEVNVPLPGNSAPAPAGSSANAPQPASNAPTESSAAQVTSALPESGDLTLADHSGDSLVGLTLRPGRPGANTILVYVLPPDGESAATVVPVQLQAGQVTIPLAPCGPTCRVGQAGLQGGEQLSVRAGQADPAIFQLPQLPAVDGGQVLNAATSRMKQLRTLRFDETLSPPTPAVRTAYTFQAPDRMRFDIANSSQAIFIGSTHYDRPNASAPWQSETASGPVPVPYFIWDEASPQAVRSLGTDTLDGRSAQVVSFFESLGKLPVWFKLWIADDGLVHQAAMRAPGHFMDHRYYDFDAPISIDPPLPSN